MEFLHEMGYNYIRAKFFIMFPYYLNYNRYRCHKPLKLSDAQMASRIAQHLESLKSTKEKQLQRWIGTVQTSIESRIHINKLNTLIQVAKQNKYEIPEAIRQHVQRSIKTGRQIKKTLHSTRLSLDKLISKRDSLQECKIITNEMIQYQETVGRCEEWLRKQKNFEETFFTFDPEPHLIPIKDKIEFRTLQLLVNEFNNLPLIYDNFEKTTGALYQTTIQLLDKLPPLNKAAKTRTAQNHTGNIRIGIDVVRQFLNEIQKCPVEHEDFVSFQSSVCEHLQWLERIGMWLEDEKYEKSLKILNQYSKIIADIPIANKIQHKLQSRLEYYEIMEKVKKDISNPAKYEQIKDAIRKLKEKGYETCQYAKIQTRIISYMGWYESQQILNQDRVPNQNIDLFLRKKNILQRMIGQEDFEAQLQTARVQLNIPEQVWVENEGKLKNVEGLKAKIESVITPEETNIFEMVDSLKQCIKNGIIFPQFEAFYEQIINIFNVLGQMCFLLLSNYDSLPDNKQCFLNRNDVEVIVSVIYEHRQSWELKQLQTKEGGDVILEKTKINCFPRHLPEYFMYLELMEKSQEWNVKAQNLINAFKEEAGDVNIKQLMQESKSCLHSKGIEQELNKIDIVLRWKQKISRKLADHRESPFEQSDTQFIAKLEKDLCEMESIQECGQKMKFRALDYLLENSNKITETLEKISTIEIQCTYKLSEMNKFLKQIDREIQKYKLEDKNILRLREQLHEQLMLSDEWKERYLAVKRFEKKKLRQKDEDIKEVEIQIECDENNRNGHSVTSDGIVQVAYVPQLLNSASPVKRKYYIKNGQFCWYFKLPLMILEFYNGYHLKFAIEDQVRLKGILSDVYRFIAHYTTLMDKADKNDHQLLSLEAEGTKIPLFFRQTFVLSKKKQYLTVWKELADSVLKSVPVLNMQLKARKPEQLLELLEQKKTQMDEGKEEGRGEQTGSKRKRKQNTFYSNEDMTLITEETFGLKTKKKRKGNNPDQEYRNTAVASTAKKLARSQKEDVERAQALLNGEVPAQLIQIDDPKEYCICRYGVPNENSVMIQCEHKCTEWFHIECLGIKKHQTKSDIRWKCVGCKALYKEESLGYFFWDSHAKISFYALKQLVEEGRQLNVDTQELKKLEVLYTKVENWRQNTNAMLKRVCETTPEDLHLLQPEIYELFLHSLWLPIYHSESKILRKLVLLARGEQ